MVIAKHPATLASGRFEVLDVLGEGGMGVVYRALDRDRGVQVAIKTLRNATPEDVLRFKTEFRSLRDIRHPNLVELGELFETDDGWMFSMELVRGVPLLAWTSRDSDTGYATPSTQAIATIVDHTTELSTEILTHGARSGLRAVAPPMLPKCDVDRVRQALGGLANALAALHRAGKVHRDVKPSNVIVDERGRAVLLDFGVIAELREAHAHEPGALIGTISHMAPEQARGDVIEPAADWYAFGVVLFQAFAGRLPFVADTAKAMLEFKQRGTPPPLESIVHDVPPELSRLCARLLDRDPTRRATEADVFAALGVARTEEHTWSRSTEGQLFVGRRVELATLERALEDSRNGAVYIEVVGESGVGKSALVDHFCELVRAQHRKATVLRGRCHHRELVAFNAFDGLVHDLARWLMARRSEKVAPLVPRHVGDLLAVFPDLHVVDVFEAAALAGPGLDDTSATDLRGRGFTALRELLVSLSVRGPVVLAIDDLQWADEDSFALLRELVSHRRAPPMLVIATVRTGEGRREAPRAHRRIDLAGLSPADAGELLRRLLDDAQTVSTDTPIIAESAGHPLFLAELARHGSGVRLDDAIWLRVSALDPAAQRTLVAIAAAGMPLAREVVVAAAGLAPAAAEATLGTLAREQLVRVRGIHLGDFVEPFHDRVRESVLANQPAPVLRAVHRRLAELLVARGAPADAIFTHYDAAGDIVLAAPYLLAAAANALRTYAFARAAELHRRALDLLSLSTTERVDLLARLAEALANDGRTAEAADRYLEAAHLARPDSPRELDLLRHAAERYLMSGRLGPGLATARAVLARIDMVLPEARVRTIAGIVWSQLRLRGTLAWPPAAATAPPSMDAEICFSISAGLSMVDPLVGAYFSGRAALLALRHGNTTQIARAMSSATVGAALLGRRERAARLMDAAQRAAASDTTPISAWYARLARTATAFVLDNDFHACLSTASTLEAEWYALGRGPGWETDVARHFSLAAQQMLGQLHDFRTRLETMIDAARRTGDLFHEVTLRVRFAVRHLLVDDPARARADVLDAIAAWLPSADNFGTQRAWALWSRTRIMLYAGDLDRLAPDLDDEWQRMRRSLVARLPAMKVEWLHTYGTYLLGRALAARSPRESAALLRDAEHTADELAKLPFPVAPASALLLRAGLASTRGADTVAPLRAAIDAAAAHEFRVFIPFLRQRLGEALRDPAMIADANAAALAMGFSNPARAAEMAYPSGQR